MEEEEEEEEEEGGARCVVACTRRKSRSFAAVESQQTDVIKERDQLSFLALFIKPKNISMTAARQKS